MDQRDSGNEQPRKPAENRNSSTLVWFALIIVVAMAIAMFLLLNQTQKTIRYGDFADLLAQTRYVEKGSRVLAKGYLAFKTPQSFSNQIHLYPTHKR